MSEAAEEHVDGLLRAVFNAAVTEKGRYYSTQALKDHLVASGGNQRPKAHGFNRAVAQGFLKRLLSPYGQA